VNAIWSYVIFLVCSGATAFMSGYFVANGNSMTLGLAIFFGFLALFWLGRIQAES
jgi:hypothetical protein